MRSFSIVTSVMTLSSAQRPAVLIGDMTNVQANPVQANQHRMLRSMKNADAIESTAVTSVGGVGRSLASKLKSIKNFPKKNSQLAADAAEKRAKKTKPTMWGRFKNWVSPQKKAATSDKTAPKMPLPTSSNVGSGASVEQLSPSQLRANAAEQRRANGNKN